MATRMFYREPDSTPDEGEDARKSILNMAEDPIEAGKILEAVWKFIKLDVDNQVLYWYKNPKEEDVRRGSDVVSLLNYFTVPGKPRPPDAEEFGEVIKEAGVKIKKFVTWKTMY